MKWIIFFAPLFLGACMKKYGCQDPEATNYDPFATKHDYACSYQSQVHFNWYQDSVFFQDIGVTSISIFLEDTLIFKDIDITEYCLGNMQGDCQTPGVFSLIKRYANAGLQSNAKHPCVLRVMSQKDSLLMDELVEIKPNCTVVSLNF